MPHPHHVKRVAVIGAGTIGASWTAWFLSRGMTVAVSDPNPAAEAYVRRYVEKAWPILTRLGMTADASPDAWSFHATPQAAVAEAEFVQENAPERIAVKRELFAAIEDAMRPDAILASSSSGIMMSDMQEGLRTPGRFVIGHPFNPPHLIPLVEVVGGRRTSDEAMDAAMGLMRRLGRSPVRLHKELPGHVVNRLQAALWREAYSLVNEGVVSVADLDRAVSSGPGLRWALLGPFATQHLSGGPGGLAHVLDHLGPPMVDWWADLGAPELTPELCALLVQGVEAEVGGREQDLERRRDQGLRELLASKARLGLDGTEPRAESVEAAP
jgi:carnitine 3-dehydrogenase